MSKADYDDRYCVLKQLNWGNNTVSNVAHKLQVGVASIAAAVQRGGGSKQHPGSTLDDDLEVIAASIESAALPEAHVFGTAFCGMNKPEVQFKP